jgi:hypothetical protein
MSSILRGLCLLILAALAACGGGGGDDGGDASVSSNINEDNYASFASPLARAVMSGGDSTESGDSFRLNGTIVIDGDGYAMTSTTLRFNVDSGRGEGSVTLRDFLGNKVTLRARGDTFDLEFRPLGVPFPLIIPGFLWSVFRLPG